MFDDIKDAVITGVVVFVTGVIINKVLGMIFAAKVDEE